MKQENVLVVNPHAINIGNDNEFDNTASNQNDYCAGGNAVKNENVYKLTSA